LQSFTNIAIGVESNDGGIPRINSYIYGSSLVLGKINANFEAQPLKVLVVKDLSFHASSQLKNENNNQT